MWSQAEPGTEIRVKAGGADPAQVVGAALPAQQPAGAHSHDYSTSISEQKMVIAKGSTEHLGTHGSHAFSGTTASGPLGMPYVQLLLCQKCDDYAQPLPASLNNVIAYGGNNCPAATSSSQGWTPVGNDLGRLMVGLAPGAANPGKTFGGAALQPLAAALHQHSFSSHGVTASNGSFLGSYEAYGHAGSRDYSGTTENGSGELPYLASVSCRPCGGSGQAACASQVAAE